MNSEVSAQTETGPGSVLSRRRFLGLVLAAFLWFGGLGYRDLTHSDEGRYSEISREMASTGDWVTPRLNGLKYFEKPPLQYWATALAFDAFGESEFVARLWVGLCGFATVILVYWTALRLWGARTADYAGITCASMIWIMGMSHIATLDMGVTFFMTLALCGFLRAQHDGATEGETRRWMWITWGAMAGALLSKGLIGVVLPGAVLTLYSLICRDWRPWRRLKWYSGVPIFAALAAPWHVLVSRRNPEWARFYFIHEHLNRFLTTEHHRRGAWFYFLPLLVAGLLPWTTLLPQIVRRGWRSDTGRFQTNRFLLIWSAFIFVFFSLSGSKLPSYILPIFPALGLLLAQVLAAGRAGEMRRHALAIVVLMAVLSLGSLIFGRIGYGSTPMEMNRTLSHWALAGSMVFGLMAAAAARAATAERKSQSVLLLAVGSLLFLNATMLGYQSYSPLLSSAVLSRKLRPIVGADTPLFAVNYYDQTLPFYMKRTVTLVGYVDEFDLGERQEPQKWVPDLPTFGRLWRELPRGVAVTNPASLVSLRQLGIPMQIVDETPHRIVFRKP
ncbi:MAG: glycosyltransferase family 39 protein [Anaerolineaceae bacterium]